MQNGKKVFNVLGIVASAVLSVVLVLVLTVLPTVLSALSLLTPQTLVNAVSKVDFGEMILSMAEESGADMDTEQAKQLGTFFSTDAAKEILKVYTQNVFDILGGESDTQGLTPDLLRQLVDENMDGIAKALRESGGKYAQMSEQELVDDIQKSINEKAEDIIEMLPDPQELRESLTEEALPVSLELLRKSVISAAKLSLIGIAVVLSLMIFGCRFVQWRGLKWLAVDLLVAGVLSGGICAVLGVGKSLVDVFDQTGSWVQVLLDSLFSSLSAGATVRTVIMLAIAAVLLTAYILICKNRKKQTAPVVETAVAVPQGESV